MWGYCYTSVDKILEIASLTCYTQRGQWALEKNHLNMKVIFHPWRKLGEYVKTQELHWNIAVSVSLEPFLPRKTFEIICNENQIFTRGRDCHQPPVTKSHLRLDYCSAARRPGVCGAESSPHLLCLLCLRRHRRRGRIVTVWLQKTQRDSASVQK